MKTFTSGITSQRRFKASNIFFSFIVAILLSLLTFKGSNIYNPLWVVLFIIYWHIRLDIKYSNSNLNFVFILGILCDFINGTTIGITSLSFLIISFLLSIFKPKIYFYTMLQVFILVFALLVVNQTVFLVYYISCGILSNITLMHFFAPIVMSLLVWPIIEIVLDRFLLKNK